MLARENRLVNEEDFEKLKKKGRVVDHRLFRLAVFERGDKDPNRFGFVVSKAISTKASIRNKVKRALREGVRHNIAYTKEGYDGVFVARKGVEREYTDKIMAAVRQTLEEAKLIK